MAINLYYLLILIIIILPIKCNTNLYSVLNNDNGHIHEPSVYKYSQQGNIKQFINMKNFILNNNNIFLSIILINIIPIIIIIFFLIPITILRRYQYLLIIFLSFSSGGLMADVFLRLFPYIIQSYSDIIISQNQSHVHHHHHQQHDNTVGLFILMGIFLSFIIEKFYRYIQNNEKINDTSSAMNSTNILAYLFLFVNLLYNYTNNLIQSKINLTNVIYEILHVFYGYAILIYSGWTTPKAMQYQLLIKLISIILCLVNLQFQSNLLLQLWANQIFLPIIAGIFIYISTVHIIPKVIETNNGNKETFFKIFACISSVFIIFKLKNYE